MSKNKNTLNTLSTLSVFSSFAKKLFAENHYAKIHSVFSNGFNLKFSNMLVYVSPHQEGMLSGSGLSIDKEIFDQLVSHLKPGIHVRLRKNQLMFYTRPHIFTVDMTEKSVKELTVVPVTEDEIEGMQFSARLEKMNLLEKSGFYENESLIAILEEILQVKEISDYHVKRLIGAGVGLTPTGDDFLQGAILMEQSLKHLPHIQSLVEEQLVKRSTTEVSLSYYQSLFKGYSNEPLVLLFKAVKDQEDIQFNKAIGYLKNYGSTSGYDLLMGMSTYLQII